MLGRTLTVRIGGEAGDGVVACGEQLADLLTGERHWVLVHRGYARVSSAPESVQLRSGDLPPLFCVGDSLDILFAWSQEAYDRYRDELWPEGLLLYDPDRVRPRDADAPIRHGIALTRLAAASGVAGAKSLLATGVVARLLGVPREAATSIVPADDADSAARVAAFLTGFDTARRPPLGVIHFELSRWSGPPRTPHSGAQAIAAAVAAAGARRAVCVGSARDLELARALAESGVEVRDAAERELFDAATRDRGEGPLVVIQAAGLRGLPRTLEGLGGQPILLVRAPRAGTLGGEDDLAALRRFAPPPLVFAPATVEECAAHGRRATEVCARYSGPVVLYVDPVLEDSIESVPEHYGEVAPMGELPGLAEAAQALAQEWSEVHVPPGARLGVVAWGATQGAIREARLECEAEGLRIAHLHPRVLSPLVDDGVQRFLAPLECVVVVEPEPAGPLAQVLRDVYGAPVEPLSWPAGIPLTPGAVYRALAQATGGEVI